MNKMTMVGDGGSAQGIQLRREELPLPMSCTS